MSPRQTAIGTDSAFDSLRRGAISNPQSPGAYGQLTAQHFGAFPVDRLRPMLRWLRVLVGSRPMIERLDGVFVRLERAHRTQSERLGAAVATHTVVVNDRPIRFVTDDPAADRFIKANLIAQWPYEAGVVRYLTARLRADDVFVDVGAHAGFFSLIAAALGAATYAIEPQRDLIRVIERNAVLNGADRLHALLLAVSDRECLTSVMRVGGSPGMQMHGEANRERTSTPLNRHVDWVPTVRLDSLFLDALVRPQVVKIDVEGLEVRALDGASGLIAGNDTVFIVEIHPHLIGGFGGSLDRFSDWFGSADWRVIDVSDDPPVPVALADGIARAAAGTREQDGRVTLAFEPAAWPSLYPDSTAGAA